MGKKLNILSNTTWVMLTLIRTYRHYTWDWIGLLFEINFTKCSNLYFFFVSVCQSPKYKKMTRKRHYLNWIPLFVYFVYFFKKSSWNLKVENYTKDEQIWRDFRGHLVNNLWGFYSSWIQTRRDNELLLYCRWYNMIFHISKLC